MSTPRWCAVRRPPLVSLDLRAAFPAQLDEVRFERIARDRQQVRPHVVIHLGEQLIDRAATGAAQHGQHLRLAPCPMRNDSVDDRDRIAHHTTVARRNGPQRIGLESFQRIEIRAHVAIGRQDDGRYTFEHVITGKQQARFFEQETNMIGGMTRRVDCTQPKRSGHLYITGRDRSGCATRVASKRFARLRRCAV